MVLTENIDTVNKNIFEGIDDGNRKNFTDKNFKDYYEVWSFYAAGPYEGFGAGAYAGGGGAYGAGSCFGPTWL